MKISFRCLAALSFSAFALTAASNAFADCSTMNDEEWNDLSAQMASAYDKSDYENALRIGKQLTVICNRSPVVNFTMSEIYRKSGNEQESDKYAERATQYILDYPVPQALNERIWVRAAENKLPYKRQLSDLQGRMTKMAGDLKTCNEEKNTITEEKNALAANLATLETTQKENAIHGQYQLKESKSHWGAAMWTGVGVAAAGIALTVTGAVLSNSVDKIEKVGEATVKKSGYAVTKSYVASWSLLGAGLALAVGGTVLTGIAGYHYTSIDLDNDGTADESVSFNVSPTSFSFGMTF